MAYFVTVLEECWWNWAAIFCQMVCTRNFLLGNKGLGKSIPPVAMHNIFMKHAVVKPDVATQHY